MTEPLDFPAAPPPHLDPAQEQPTQQRPAAPVLPIPQASAQSQETNSTVTAPTVPATTTPAAPTDHGASAGAAPGPGEPAPNSADVHDHDHDHDHGPAATSSSGGASPTPTSNASDTTGSPGPDEAAATDDDAAASPISASDAIGMATGAATPAMQAILGLPSVLAGMGSGLMAPFTQILDQFGSGEPAMPSSSGMPADVLRRLSSTDPSSGMSGLPEQAYGADLNTQASQAAAMDKLEDTLRTALEDSSANATLGRDKIKQIIDQVKSTLQMLGPVAALPGGQIAVLSTLTSGLSAAGAVLTDGVGKDTLNASTVKTMSADYVKGITAGDQLAGSEAGGGGPRDWAVKALAANGITDPRAVRNWLPGLLTMGSRESGNNPRAVNGWDSNARKGTPSKGWMQTIEPTFAAHWRPGTSRDIFNPVSNAAAAIHYVMTRYNVSPNGADLMHKVQQSNPYAAPRGY